MADDESQAATQQESSQPFEIADFHTASNWEKFIARIESILREWSLYLQKQRDSSSPPRYPMGEAIEYSGRYFQLTYYTTPQGPPPTNFKESVVANTSRPYFPPPISSYMNPNNDFPLRAHFLARWFGITEYVILAPAGDNPPNPSEASFLLSTLVIALDNCKSHLTAFVPLLDPARGCYIGYSSQFGITVRYDTDSVHVPRVPGFGNTHAATTQLPIVRTLDDVAYLFVSKIRSESPGMPHPPPPVCVSIRYTFMRTVWPEEEWRDGDGAGGELFSEDEDDEGTRDDNNDGTKPSDIDSDEHGVPSPQRRSQSRAVAPSGRSQRSLLQSANAAVTGDAQRPALRDPWRLPARELVWGPSEDPLEGLHLAATFPLELLPSPSSASAAASAKSGGFDPARAPNWTLRATLPHSPHCPLADAIRTLIDALANVDGRQSMAELKPPTATHTPAGVVEGGAVTPVGLSTSQLPPVPNDAIAPIGPGIAGGVHIIRAMGSFTRTLTASLRMGRYLSPEEIQGILNELFDGRKDAALRRGTATPLTDNHFGELRGCPPLTLLGSIALYALQMDGPLGIAMFWEEFVRECRWHWENGVLLPRIPVGRDDVDTRCCLLYQKLQMLNYCIARKICHDELHAASANSASGWDEADPLAEVTVKREGALSPVPGLTLLASGEPVWAPETQEPGPMTEDMLREQEHLFAELGSSAEATMLRARLQSVSLLSDMQAFKAANPGCRLEDFVRWYSPRDWEAVPTEPYGRLSARMQREGNLWLATWQEAIPLPAKRQKPLFDHVREAEKVLHYLDTILPIDLLDQLIRVAMVTAHYVLSNLPCARFVAVATLLDQLKSTCVRAVHDGLQAHASEVYEAFAELERVASRATSLLHKLPGEDELIIGLLSNAEVPIAKQKRRKIARLFAVHDVADNEPRRPSSVPRLPSPDAREYILRTVTPHPFPTSRPVGHRLYALLTETECRIASAIASDE